MEKECKVCGTKFEAKSPLRVYCDDCQKHLCRNRNEVAAGLRRIAQADKPKTEIIVCETCGKSHEVFLGKFVSWRDDKNVQHKFCSPSCREKYIGTHTFCKHCGKMLTDGRYVNRMRPEEGMYCNKECYEKAHLVRSVCQHCGKVVLKKKPATYCSRECSIAALRHII